MSTLNLRERAAKLREGLDDIKGGTRARLEQAMRDMAEMGEKLHETQEHVESVQRQTAHDLAQLRELTDGLPDMVSAVEAAVDTFKEEGVSSAKPAAPSPQPTAAPRYAIEAPTASVTEDMPGDHAELDALTVYRFREGDERAKTQARVAIAIAEIEQPCAYKDRYFIAASVNEILGVMSEHFEGEPWDLLRAGTLPYASVIDASKYAATGGIDAGSVQRGIEVDRVRFQDFVSWAMIQRLSGRI